MVNSMSWDQQRCIACLGQWTSMSIPSGVKCIKYFPYNLRVDCVPRVRNIYLTVCHPTETRIIIFICPHHTDNTHPCHPHTRTSKKAVHTEQPPSPPPNVQSPPNLQYTILYPNYTFHTDTQTPSRTPVPKHANANDPHY